MRKILSVAVVVCCLLLCSCGGLGFDINDSISPPKPSGEMYNIQKALELYADGNLQLVYPSEGAYRSAIITEDIDGDKLLEVFAFYRTETDDKSTVMHINYIKRIKGEWVSVSDIQVAASGVLSVEFAQFQKNQPPQVVVSWSRLTSLEKLLSVYSISNGVLTEMVSTPYSAYSTCDFNGDGFKEILTLYVNAEEKTATASWTYLADNGNIVKSTCKIDSSVTDYSAPLFSKLKNGTTAVFVDAQKSGGTITEILLVKKGKLVNAVGDSKTGANLMTLRASLTKVQDFDGDGCLDIPLTTQLPVIPGEETADSVYMTTWNRIDDKGLSPICNALINYSDGYQLVVPDGWVSNFTVQRNVQRRERIMYRWDAEIGNTGEEIMRIEAVSVGDWERNATGYEQYHELIRSDDLVYAVKFANSALTPDLNTVKNNFTIMNDFK